MYVGKQVLFLEFHPSHAMLLASCPKTKYLMSLGDEDGHGCFPQGNEYLRDGCYCALIGDLLKLWLYNNLYVKMELLLRSMPILLWKSDGVEDRTFVSSVASW